MRSLALLCLLLTVACGSDPSEPKARPIPRLGTYRYSLIIPFVPAAVNEAHYQGTMTITFASADSIAATVDVKSGWYPAFNTSFVGLKSATRFGWWNATAYYLLVEQAGEGGRLIYNRIRAREDGSLECVAAGLTLFENGGTRGITASCALGPM